MYGIKSFRGLKLAKCKRKKYTRYIFEFILIVRAGSSLLRGKVNFVGFPTAVVRNTDESPFPGTGLSSAYYGRWPLVPSSLGQQLCKI